MIEMKDFMELIEYKITEGDSYGWSCYGPNAYQLSSWNGVHGKGGWSFNIVFDTRDHTVYEVEVCDYTNDRAYRIFNPDTRQDYYAEADQRGEYANQAWDDVDYVEIDVVADFMEKATAIKNGEDYDTRVQVQINFSDDELFEYMKIAHDRDMTFNQLVEEALKAAIQQHKEEQDEV